MIKAKSGCIALRINGDNFLEDTVIDDAIAGVTYSIQSLVYSKSNTGKDLLQNISQTKGKLFTISKDNFDIVKQGVCKNIDEYLDILV